MDDLSYDLEASREGDLCVVFVSVSISLVVLRFSRFGDTRGRLSESRLAVGRLWFAIRLASQALTPHQSFSFEPFRWQKMFLLSTRMTG